MNGVPDLPELLLRERAWLHALARQLVQRHERADEAAHDALATACTQTSPLITRPRAWLAAILTRQLAGNRRAAHRRSAREMLAARPEALPPVDDTVARFEVQRDVANAVLALGEPYRTTVLLRYWEELSPAAIGKRMGVPVETVRTRVKRGMALLRDRLDRAHGGDRRAWAVPLWAAARPVGSFASFLAGVTLMTAMQKLFVGGVAVAAALLFWVAKPWVSAGATEPAANGPAPALVSTPQPPRTEAAEPAVPVAGANDRVVVANAVTEPLVVVTGTVVDDETSTPLAGARVRLTGSDFTESLGIEAITKEDGTFLLQEAKGPERDGRRVIVEASDHALVHEFTSYDPKRTDQQKIDMGTIRLVRGTVLSGQVVDLDGLGVADAELFLSTQSMGYGTRGPENLLEGSVSVGRGDAAGRFHLDHPVRPDVNHHNLLFAVTPRGIGWGRFEAANRRLAVSDLVIRLRPGVDVRVLVQDRDGLPLAGATVRAMPRFGPIGITTREWRTEVSRQPAVRSRFQGQTDAAGGVRLLQLPVGERQDWLTAGYHERLYDLAIEAAGYSQQPLCALELRTGAEQQVVVRLVDTRQVAVTVDVRDDLGAPITDATVDAGETRSVQARTDAAGHAELTVPATASISVTAEAPGHRRAHQLVKLEAGAPVRVSLTLPRTCPLDGRIVYQFGAPVAGMWVFMEDRQLGVTGADGRFHADACPMGTRKIVAAIGPGVDSSRWIGTQTPDTIDAERGPVTLTMQRRTGNVDVRIVVVDAGSGQALEPVETFLALYTEEGRGGFFIRKLHDVSLGLVVAKDCAAGRWRLSVRTASGHRGALTFALTEGQLPASLRLELPAPGTVIGRLQFLDVAPPANVTVNVRLQTSDPTAWTAFRYPGRWQVDAASQSTSGTENAQMGSLRMQPARNPAFRLESADATDTLVFTVTGDGIAGEASVRVEPGQTREITVEVRPKARPR